MKRNQILAHYIVLIYSRVSKKDELTSSEGQEQICKDYLHSLSIRENFTYEIYDIFIEQPGRTGAEYTKRPLYRKMLQLMKDGIISAICTKESSRLERNSEHSEQMRKLAEKTNIRLIAWDLDYDIHSPSGQFFHKINSAKNEYERQVIGERTRLGIRNSMRVHQHIPSHTIPLGFKKNPVEKGRWIPIEEEIAIVRLIFITFNKKLSYSETAKEINNLGYLAKKGIKFTPELIKRILSNIKYIGEMQITGEELVVKLPYGPQIDITIFEEAQINIKKLKTFKNANRRASRIFLLVSLLYSKTGNKFISTSSGKDSEKYAYYRLVKEDITLPAEKIESLILKSILHVAQQGDIKKFAGKIKSQQFQESNSIFNKIQTSEKLIAKLNREKSEVFNLLLLPESRSTTLIKASELKLEEMDKQINSLQETVLHLTQESQLINENGVKANEALSTLGEELFKIIEGSNNFLKRRIIRTLIKKIVIDISTMVIKIQWQIKASSDEIILFNNISLPPIKRFDEIQFKLLGLTPEEVESTPLYNEYVVKKQSSTAVAKNFGVTRSTVLKYLKKIQIKSNPSGISIHRKRGTNYGKNFLNNYKIQNNHLEINRIEKAKQLRKEGYTYRKIAKLFNDLNIPTKHKKSWHGRSIQEIIRNN